MTVNETLQFDACETRKCVAVMIVDDFYDEQNEQFYYTLERTPYLHPNIQLDPVNGLLVIFDDDSKWIDVVIIWNVSLV